jgi:hypothetical protein
MQRSAQLPPSAKDVASWKHVRETDPQRLHRQAADEAAGLRSKTDCGGVGTRRVAESSLESDGSPDHLMLGDWCLWMRWARTSRFRRCTIPGLLRERGRIPWCPQQGTEHDCCDQKLPSQGQGSRTREVLVEAIDAAISALAARAPCGVVGPYGIMGA